MLVQILLGIRIFFQVSLPFEDNTVSAVSCQADFARSAVSRSFLSSVLCNTLLAGFASSG